MGRPCSICCDSGKFKLVAEMIGAGATDQAVADQLGGVNRMAVARHRHNHIVAPAKAIASMAAKGQDLADRRAQVMAAAEAGDPTAFIALSAIVADLKRVHDRLERTADAAEQDNQRNTVATVSAQQLRATEVRAKMGGVGGYAPGKAGTDVATAPFAVNIYLGEAVESFVAATTPERRVIEGNVASEN